MDIQNGSQMAPVSWQYVKPPIFESFFFENFDVDRCRAWMERNWSLSIYICAIYLAIIFTIRKLMENRKPFGLRGSLALWNLAFAIFSLFGLVRCLPELMYVLNRPNGFFRSICVRADHNQPAAFWAWAFTLSKVMELGDTFFIVLRKKPLQFIHYYHHSVALVVCWCFYPDYEPIFRWFGTGNYFVHFFLYSYLFLKSVNVNLPKAISKALLSIEFLQMILGASLNSYSIWVKWKGETCERSTMGIVYQMLVYLSFVVYFIYIFKMQAATRKDGKKKIL